jgi:hypothetical protein
MSRWLLLVRGYAIRARRWPSLSFLHSVHYKYIVLALVSWILLVLLMYDTRHLVPSTNMLPCWMDISAWYLRGCLVRSLHQWYVACLYRSVCTYVCEYVCAWVHVCMCACMCVHVCMYACMYAWRCSCLCASVSVFLLCVSVCERVCVCSCLYAIMFYICEAQIINWKW